MDDAHQREKQGRLDNITCRDRTCVEFGGINNAIILNCPLPTVSSESLILF